MTDIKNEEAGEKKSLNFIEQAVEKDLKEGKNGGKVQTRFPPEPNGYLHIGHAKAICLDFGIAEAHGGVCNLRFDDTNPTKEDVEYVEAIKEDIQWLGYQWGNEYYASDYFQQLWDFAIRLIQEGKAYIDEQTSEQIAQQKGTPTQPGVESPYRNRPIEESLELFKKMNSGEIEEGAMVLRAKIDMANPNMHFRDPIIYRVVKHPHHRTGTTWKAYPMYDFAHGQSDFFEGVTHSLCTLEFVVHRPLYDLFIDWLKEGKDLNDHRPRQTEFNKLNLSYTLMSKRNLLTLVKEGLVNGWDDPRMPTIKGLRRRGYTADAINSFCQDISVTRTTMTTIDWSRLEHFCRESLEPVAPRAFAVLHPVKLVLVNKPDDFFTVLKAPLFPKDAAKGTRDLPYQKVLYVDREDVKKEDEAKFLGFAPGKVVSLKYADMVKCEEVVCNEAGEVVEVRCSVLSEEEAKDAMANKKRKLGSMHWVAGSKMGEEPVRAEVRLYNHLFLEEDPSVLDDWVSHINKESEIVLPNVMIEQSLVNKKVEDHVQFERLGYFVVDKDSANRSKIVYNRTCPLKSN